ncbi:MAG: fibronectin type III domain-containing protein [Bacteroidales bacterium]|nr:fibronectin type III domain-containing protein [Bacteroidales bacterium]
MSKFKRIASILMLAAAVVFAAGCTKPDEPNNGGNNNGGNNGGGNNGGGETIVELPQVMTSAVSNVTTTEATCGGSILSNGGCTISECGVCWSTDATPTVDGDYATASVTSGTFTVTVQNLTPNTAYNVRAYAKNEAGIAYGTLVSFITLDDSPAAPEGAVKGKFSINAGGKQVYFSHGNLQYQATTNTWRFADQQWNYVGGSDCYGVHYGNVAGSSNSFVSSTYNGWIDYFGFGTSGWDNGNIYYHPYDIGSEATSWQGEINFGFGPLADLTGDFANADWGVYNAISNGGSRPGMWRTLTQQEWEYVLNERNGSRFAFAKVNEVYGFLLLPDDWSTSTYNLNNINSTECPLDANVISLSAWATLEAKGVVFLPCGGWSNYCTEFGYQVEVKCPGTGAMYWTSSYWNNPDSPWGQPYIMEASYGGSPGVFTDVGIYLCQVRLVQEVE